MSSWSVSSSKRSGWEMGTSIGFSLSGLPSVENDVDEESLVEVDRS